MSQEATEQAKPAKKKSKLPLILGVVGVLALGGGGAFWFLRPAPVAAEAASEEPPAAEIGGGVVSFEPFVVNLTDEGGGRFLRASVQLVVADPETAKEITENAVQMVRLRSSLLELLAEQTSDMLITAEGKAALKEAIADRADGVLAPHEVSDVLFSDFLVQF
jgi:flagellar FliL protein